MIRRYDSAILALLKAELSPGVPVPLNFGAPRREYGTQDEMGASPADRKPSFRSKQSIPLPSMSLTRSDWTRSAERSNFNLHRKLKWSTDLNLISQAQHPMAVDIPYQLDIWTKFRDDANILTELTMTKFPRVQRAMLIDMGEPWGVKKVYLVLGNAVDNTENESEDADREVRMTVDFILEGWLPFKSRTIRTVRKVVADVDVVRQDGSPDARVFSKTLEER